MLFNNTFTFLCYKRNHTLGLHHIILCLIVLVQHHFLKFILLTQDPKIFLFMIINNRVLNHITMFV